MLRCGGGGLSDIRVSVLRCGGDGCTMQRRKISVLRCDGDGLQRAKQLTTQKEAGNAAFRAGRLQEAYDLYSKALQIDPHNNSTNSKLFCNRATVGSKVSRGCCWGAALLRQSECARSAITDNQGSITGGLVD